MSIIKTILSRLFPFTDYPRRSNHQYVLLKHHNQSENDFEKPKNLIERSSSLTINLIVSIGIVFLTNSFVSGFNIGVLNTIEKVRFPLFFLMILEKSFTFSSKDFG